MSTRRLINDNPREVLKLLLNRLNCKFRNDYFLEMKNHPDYPSFLSFHHILKKIGIDSIAIETNFNELRDNLPKPVLIHISSNEGMFILLEKIDDEFAYIINEKNLLEKLVISKFKKIWNGYALIIDSDNITERKLSLMRRINSFLDYIRKPLCVISFALILIYFLVFNGERSFYNILYLFEFTTGIIISSIMLAEYFSNNAFIKQFCVSKNKKNIECSSILNSKDSSLWGVISWSDIGLLYFVVSFSISLFFPIEISTPYSVISSIIILPFVFYSIYYQKFVARTWCILCLCIQVVIVALFLTSIFVIINSDTEYTLSAKNIFQVVLIAIAIIAAYATIKPLIKSQLAFSNVSHNLNLLKHKSSIKNLLFNEEAAVSLVNFEPIVIGNPKGDNCITIIFSPICGPCMVKLRNLLPIISYKDNTRIELLFLVDSESSPIAFDIANRMFEIYFENQEAFVLMLSDYAQNYPRSKFEFDKIYDKKVIKSSRKMLLEKQRKWCVDNNVYATPQTLINHRFTPTVYSDEDIDYIFD